MVPSRYSIKYNYSVCDSREFNSRQIPKFKIVKVSRMNCRVSHLVADCSASGQAESSSASPVDGFKIATPLEFLTSNFLRLM